MGFFKPTIVKLGLSIVIYFLLSFSVAIYCHPIPYMGGAWMTEEDRSKGLEAYPCGDISRLYSSKASDSNSYSLTRYIYFGVFFTISYSITCLVVFLAHIVEERQKM
jgi:hypothetical protein